MLVQGLAYVDGASTFTHFCVDRGQTVPEHYRPFHLYVLIAAELY